MTLYFYEIKSAHLWIAVCPSNLQFVGVGKTIDDARKNLLNKIDTPLGAVVIPDFFPKELEE
jgi:hypothetical protein